MAIADITVLGGGIFGLSIAWRAVQRGAKVRLVERFGIGAGSSGGVVGALAPHTPENWNEKKAFQFDSLLLAEPFWQQVAQASGRDPGYARLGRIQAIADDKALTLARARQDTAKPLWQGQARWDIVPTDTFAGWAPDTPTGALIHDTLSARLHPRQACAALAEALHAQGADLVIGDAEPQGIVVEATGAAGLREMSETLGKTLGNGVKGQAALLDHDARDLPQLFLDGVHIIPHSDGTTAIGSTSERDYASGTATDTQLDTLIEKARGLCPALKDAAVLERWAAERPRAKSRAPMLGRHPLRRDRFIANGGFKIGFGMAPKVADVMVDLILDGVDTIPEAFRVEANF